MTLAVAEALNPNKPKRLGAYCRFNLLDGTICRPLHLAHRRHPPSVI